MLYRALVWRARHEGLAALAFPLGLFAFVAVVSSLPTALASTAGINDAAAPAGYRDHLGATTDAAELRIPLLIAPGLAAIVLTVGGALTARSLVGTETGRGSLEALLAAGYGPRDLANAILAFTCTIVAGLWVAVNLLAGAWLGAEAIVYGASLDLAPIYLGLLVLVPVLAGWVGTALAVSLSLLWPQFAQQGGRGISSNGNLASAIAILPGVAALLVPLMTQAISTTATAGVLAVCANVALILLGMTTTLVGAGFRPADVLET